MYTAELRYIDLTRVTAVTPFGINYNNRFLNNLYYDIFNYKQTFFYFQ